MDYDSDNASVVNLSHTRGAGIIIEESDEEGHDDPDDPDYVQSGSEAAEDVPPVAPVLPQISSQEEIISEG